MFLIYSANYGDVFRASADTAQYTCNTPNGIVHGPSVCVWLVPGTWEQVTDDS